MHDITLLYIEIHVMPQVNATLQDEIIQEVMALAAAERRSFSQMVAILVEEALLNRQTQEYLEVNN
jgi:hypothetical protein